MIPVKGYDKYTIELFVAPLLSGIAPSFPSFFEDLTNDSVQFTVYFNTDNNKLIQSYISDLFKNIKFNKQCQSIGVGVKDKIIDIYIFTISYSITNISEAVDEQKNIKNRVHNILLGSSEDRGEAMKTAAMSLDRHDLPKDLKNMIMRKVTGGKQKRSRRKSRKSRKQSRKTRKQSRKTRKRSRK